MTTQIRPPSRLGIDALIQEASGVVETSHFRIVRQADDIYQQVVAEATLPSVAGDIVRLSAVQDALDQFANVGVSGFTDAAGRNWDLASYADMAVRTASGRAAVQGHLDQIQTVSDLVIVSSDGAPCELCEPYEGTVLSISGTSEQYGSLADARDNGFQHPNCKHSLGIYIEGLTTPVDTQSAFVSAQNFEATQEQRNAERMIRKWKRREIVALDDNARLLAQRKVAQWQAHVRELVRENEILVRKSGREQVLLGKPTSSTFGHAVGGGAENPWILKVEDIDIVSESPPSVTDTKKAMESWVDQSDTMKAILRGDDISGQTLFDSAGGVLTEADKLSLVKETRDLYFMTTQGGTSQPVLYRGEMLRTEADVLAKFPIGGDIEFEPLTSTTPILETAKTYAQTWDELGAEGRGQQVILTLNSSSGHPGVWSADGFFVDFEEAMAADNGGEYILAPGELGSGYRVDSVTKPKRKGEPWRISLSYNG